MYSNLEEGAGKAGGELCEAMGGGTESIEGDLSGVGGHVCGVGERRTLSRRRSYEPGTSVST